VESIIFFAFFHAHSPDRLEQNSITLSASLLSPAVNTASEVGYPLTSIKKPSIIDPQKPSGIQETLDLIGVKLKFSFHIHIRYDFLLSGQIPKV
jgi:hypothetical protein